MMDSAAFYLVLMFIGGPAAHTVVLPMATQEACANASIELIGAHVTVSSQLKLVARCVASGFEE